MFLLQRKAKLFAGGGLLIQLCWCGGNLHVLPNLHQNAPQS